ncbi:Uncharacterised protein [Burkholderia pseudomallei]|nr:Uncharacterised protein [Burkholderia pseudomallei]CAJ7105459.1 Uncharacterised protein [Burkholderia pseudomallei]
MTSVAVLRWAVESAHLHDDDVAGCLRRSPMCFSGEVQPKLNQLGRFAQLARTAIGYLVAPQFLIAHFRSLRDEVSTKHIKIPNVYVGLNICFKTLCEMLRIERVGFLLGAMA